MKQFIKVTTDQGVILINTSKIRIVKPREPGAEIYLDDPTLPVGYEGRVTQASNTTNHDFKYRFQHRVIQTKENFETLLTLIEQSQ